MRPVSLSVSTKQVTFNPDIIFHYYCWVIWLNTTVSEIIILPSDRSKIMVINLVKNPDYMVKLLSIRWVILYYANYHSNLNMAGHAGLCLLFSSKLVLVLVFDVFIAPCVLITADDQSGFLVECNDKDTSSWIPWWKQSFLEGNGTKCNIQCPSDCSCSLGNYREVSVNCLNGSISVTYPPNVTQLSWAHNEIKNISKDSFAGLVDTLEALHLNNNSLQHLQPGVFVRLIKLRCLDLRHNMLDNIMYGMFGGLGNLSHLDLSCNMLEEIQLGVFNGLGNLLILYLSDNMLKEIKPGVLGGLGNLSHLYLDGNMLEEIQPGAFNGLGNLSRLYLGGNMLKEVKPGVFSGMEKLERLLLNNNMLTSPLPTVLGELTRLVVFHLSNNPLAHLNPDTFHNLPGLKVLLLHNTSLTFLPKNIFQALPQLGHLDLSANDLNKLQFHPFEICTILDTLNLTQNPLKWIKKESFIGLNVSAKVFVDNPASCCFVSKANCIPNSLKSPFLTCGRLLPYDVLRIGIWIISIFAIVNNVLGILVRCKHRKQVKKVQFLLITNLSISDLLMGVYLIILLSEDLYYTDYFHPTQRHGETVICVR